MGQVLRVMQVQPWYCIEGGAPLHSLHYCMGSLKDHNTYEAEGLGVILTLELIERERNVMTATIYLDNQSVIQFPNHIKPQPGQYILSQAYDTANRITV